MPNYKGNESSLVKYKPKWRSGKTRTIRVPIAIADLVLEDAKEIDINGNISLLQVIQELKQDKENLIKRLTEKSGDSNTVTSDKAELIKAFGEAIAIPSNRGGQIKKAIAVIGELVGLDVQKTNKGWNITDTSES